MPQSVESMSHKISKVYGRYPLAYTLVYLNQRNRFSIGNDRFYMRNPALEGVLQNLLWVEIHILSETSSCYIYS